jgi:hypothetical protein
MKIAHLTVGRELLGGQIKQLEFEAAAASDMVDVSWSTIAYQSELPASPLVRRIPWLLRPMFLRNLFAWLVALKLSRENDYVLMRHITFDPFALLFAPLMHNRASVHHAKEQQELLLIAPGLKGRLASLLEGISGRVGVRRASLILGVTNEIAQYELAQHAASRPVGAYGNGVLPASIPLLTDNRSRECRRFAFICGVFSAWHGLDKLIEAVDRCDADLSGRLEVHLIGKLSNAQIAQIIRAPGRARVFRMHGVMDQMSYRDILSTCDAGVGSLAMERQGLREGSTLKVREMLAMGLPVYSGHRDADIPEDFPYYRNASLISVEDMLDFAQMMQLKTREDVAKSSTPYISKSAAMMRVASLLASFQTPASGRVRSC